jgi:hypothetical protein
MKYLTRPSVGTPLGKDRSFSVAQPTVESVSHNIPQALSKQSSNNNNNGASSPLGPPRSSPAMDIPVKSPGNDASPSATPGSLIAIHS